MRVLLGFMFGLSMTVMVGQNAAAHQAVKPSDQAIAQYIANEGVLIEQGETKIVFDPLPLSGFGTYPEPTPKETKAIIQGEGEYEGLDAVFISHAHRDHFSAKHMIEMMMAQPDLRLVAPSQALDMMKDAASWNVDLRLRIIALDMSAGEEPQMINLPDISITALRIPHAGWPAPARASVQNMVYRVQIGSNESGHKATVMHMGDADARRQHFAPHTEAFQALETDVAFPPYWFLLSQDGQAILEHDINAAQSIGVHVPIEVPQDLKQSGEDYFSVAGETRKIGK